MGKFLKKNWFVALVAVVFVGFVSFYIYDTNKGKLKGKTSNGEDVVYELNGTDTVASDFYSALYKTQGTTDLVALFKKAVADATISTTSDIKETAASNAASIRSNYSSYYGDNAESQLASDLKSTGYTDLEEYLIEMQKINQVTADYAKANFDDLKIRQISYILVKYEDSNADHEEVSEDEQSRMDAIDAAFKNGDDFATVAAAHSEDSSTASTGGNLGVIDKNSSSLDTQFLEASLALAEGETSDWVKSDSFGYFKIMCTAATPETLEANNADSNPYLQLVQNYDTTLENTAVWAKAEELGIDFKGDTQLETTIKSYFGVATDTEEKEDADNE